MSLGTLGPFGVLDELGAGGMGRVYRAQHLATGAFYALKVLHLSAEPEALARFQREGEAQALVDAHPHVGRVHALERFGEYLVLVQDLLPGGDLEERLRKGPLQPTEAVRVLTGLAEGLAHVHAQGVLHRDLKPANVLFDRDGTPKLVDFGLAKVADGRNLTQTGELLGTPTFMAPEQAHGHPLDERTDVYGLGGLLYACLSGRPPFPPGPTLKVLNQVCNDAPARLSGIPKALESACLRALAKAPGDRFPDAAAFGAALGASLEAPSPRRARALLLVGGLLALGAALAFSLSPAASPSSSSASAPPPPTEAAIETRTEASPRLDPRVDPEAERAEGRARAALKRLRTKLLIRHAYWRAVESERRRVRPGGGQTPFLKAFQAMRRAQTKQLEGLTWGRLYRRTPPQGKEALRGMHAAFCAAKGERRGLTTLAYVLDPMLMGVPSRGLLLRSAWSGEELALMHLGQFSLLTNRPLAQACWTLLAAQSRGAAQGEEALKRHFKGKRSKDTYGSLKAYLDRAGTPVWAWPKGAPPPASGAQARFFVRALAQQACGLVDLRAAAKRARTLHLALPPQRIPKRAVKLARRATNPRRGLEWLLYATFHGSQSGLVRLGKRFAFGESVRTDPVVAEALLLQALVLGMPKAGDELLKLYVGLDQPELLASLKSVRDQQASATLQRESWTRLLKRAALVAIPPPLPSACAAGGTLAPQELRTRVKGGWVSLEQGNQVLLQLSARARELAPPAPGEKAETLKAAQARPGDQSGVWVKLTQFVLGGERRALVALGECMLRHAQGWTSQGERLLIEATRLGSDEALLGLARYAGNPALKQASLGLALLRLPTSGLKPGAAEGLPKSEGGAWLAWQRASGGR